MGADADRPDAEATDVAEEEPADAALDERVSEAQQAFERGDFATTRRIVSRFAGSPARDGLSERDRDAIENLERAVVRDRVTMTLGIAAAIGFSAIFAYYVLM